MKRAICLQHVPFEGPGAFADILVDHNYIVSNHLVPVAGLPSDPGDFLLIMGGPMSVNDADPWIANEIGFIRDAMHRGMPVLGVCLGSQLMAKALGAEVRPGPALELGMVPISLTAQGQDDPVFGTVPDPFEVFQWHGEAFELPTGSVALASSALFPFQAFRFGTKAYGLLFHLEMQRDGLQALCAQCPDDLVRADQDAADLARRAEARFPSLHTVAERLVAHLVGQPT